MRRGRIGVLKRESSEEIIVGSELVIYPRIALVPLLREIQVGKIIVQQSVGLRRRVGVNELRSNGVEAFGRNAIAGELSVCGYAVYGRRGERIEDVHPCTGEIAATHSQRRNAGIDAVHDVTAIAFIVDEKECLVAAVVDLWDEDGAAEAETKLIEPEGRECCALRVEETPGIHGGVAEELESAAMDLVGPGLGDNVDDGAGIASLVGGEHIGLDFEFTDSFDA